MKKTLLLLLVLTSLHVYAQKKQLYLNLQKDSTYYLTADVEMNIDQLIEGKHQVIKTTITGTTSHKIISIQDTVYNMEVTYKSLGMVMDFGGRRIEFNSEGDTSSVINKAVKSMLNKSFTMTMSKRGHIMDVKNFDKLFTGEFSAIGLTEEKKAQLMAQLRQSFSESSLKSSLQQTFLIYPKRPLGLKDVWTDQTNLDAGGISAKMKNTYTVDNITGNSYEISIKSVVVSDKIPSFRQSGQVYFRITNISGTTNATCKIDKVTGWLTESQTTKHIAGTAEVKQSLTGPVMATYPMTIDVTLKATGK